MALVGLWDVKGRFFTTRRSWQTVASPTTADLYGISFDTRGQGFIVGANGIILGLKQGSWVKVPSPVSLTLYAVSALSTGGFRAVGQQGVQLRFASGYWVKEMSQTAESLYATTQDGWLLGDHETILIDVTGQWMQDNEPNQSPLFSVAVGPDGDVWAVGYNGSNVGAILHESGGQWSQAVSPAWAPLNSVAIGSTGDTWAVGGAEFPRWNHR